MIHILKRCPHCDHTIKIPAAGWRDYKTFYCTSCGTHLKKVAGKWGGIMGFKLEVA